MAKAKKKAVKKKTPAKNVASGKKGDKGKNPFAKKMSASC
jgi:hypothetical protein